ncbi:hypothetical protein [Pantoea agglomerans]|uniref:hypothetical protein n=1 Tax=Enterobacter agglomerans TaxID=549 RepID=UPI0034CFA41C
MKRFFNKKIIALSVLLSLSHVTNAAATGWPVSDVGLLAYLSNSAAGGVVADNGGVISLLNQIESDLAHISTQNKNLTQNANDAENQRSKWSLQDQASLSRIPDAQACYSASNASMGSAGSSGASSKATSSDVQAKNRVEQAVSTSPQSKNNIYERSENQLCSDDDAKYGRGGCSAPGQYPNADIDGGGLSGAPLTASEIASGKTRRDVYTNDEAKKTQFLVLNTTSNLPIEDIKDKAQGNTSEGVLFATKLKSYQAKSLLAQSALDRIVASNTEIDNMNAEQQNVWSSLSSVWKKLTGTDAPAKPSSDSIMKVQVLKRYTDEDWQTDVASMNEVDALRELNRQSAIKNMLAYDNNKKLDTVIQLLAAQLGNSIQPVNADDLQEMKTKIEQTK